MKKGVVRRVLILVLALMLCLGMAWYNGKRQQESGLGGIRLWYAETDCAPTVMENLLSRFREETGLSVRAECFRDEQALADSLETERPDLLFCSHIRAAHLEGIGGLVALPEALPVPTGLRGLRPTPGASFFPIGSRLPLLLQNTALTGEAYDSLESLLESAGNAPFLTADDWSMLLYTAMRAKGERPQGIPEKDRESKNWKKLYNLLCEASFRGGLVITTRDAPEYVRQGLLPCAIVRSSALAGLEGDGLRVSPAPLPEGTDAQYPAELMGFLLPNGANTEKAEAFLRWLWNGQGADTALAAGLVPIADPDPKTPADSALKRLLVSLYEGGKLFWPDAREPFFKNRESCEARLREALDLLA